MSSTGSPRACAHEHQRRAAVCGVRPGPSPHAGPPEQVPVRDRRRGDARVRSTRGDVRGQAGALQRACAFPCVARAQ
jgi:hypothetical protein